MLSGQILGKGLAEPIEIMDTYRRRCHRTAIAVKNSAIAGKSQVKGLKLRKPIYIRNAESHKLTKPHGEWALLW
jgi:hypothetical protein